MVDAKEIVPEKCILLYKDRCVFDIVCLVSFCCYYLLILTMLELKIR